MKRSFYDIFDHWNASDEQLPPMESQPINMDAVQSRVMRQVAFSNPADSKQRKPVYRRMIGIAAAAAVLTGGTITAGAVSGRMDEFFAAISGADSYTFMEDTPVAGVGMDVTEAVEQMGAYYACPDVVFDGSEHAEISLLGLYHDHNAVMLSMQVTLPEGTVLPEDANMLTNFTLTKADGSIKALEQRYFEGDFRRDTAADAGNVYHLTWFLTDPDISGGTLHVSLDGIYDTAQQAASQQAIIALQEQWREEANADELTTEQWKAIWQENDYDRKTHEARMAFFTQQDALVEGSWTADVPVPTATTQTISGTAYGMNYTLDDLSVYVSNPSEEQRKLGSAVIQVTMKDGTVYASDLIHEEETGNVCEYFAFNRGTGYGDGEEKGMISCYSEPIAPEQVEKLEMVIHYYDDDWNAMTDTYILYDAAQS